MEPQVLTGDEFQKWVRRPKRVCFLGLLRPRRPGVVLFATKLEYSHYPPSTLRNEEFQVTLIEWEDMRWTAISVPGKDLGVAKKIAQGIGIRIANGVPMLITNQGRRSLVTPGAMNVFTLENTPGHPVYDKRRPYTQNYARLLEVEDAEVARILGQASANN